nr:hypothetical protein CFP56_41418 [Quercus suber]
MCGQSHLLGASGSGQGLRHWGMMQCFNDCPIFEPCTRQIKEKIERPLCIQPFNTTVASKTTSTRMSRVVGNALFVLGTARQRNYMFECKNVKGNPVRRTFVRNRRGRGLLFVHGRGAIHPSDPTWPRWSDSREVLAQMGFDHPLAVAAIGSSVNRNGATQDIDVVYEQKNEAVQKAVVAVTSSPYFDTITCSPQSRLDIPLRLQD